MEIHKPKAAHSWREFAVEIGTIVCGILIALGLEQVVSTLEWSRKVAETREAVGLELGENLGKMENRLQLEQCLEQRLNMIANIVDHAASVGSLPPLPTPKSPPYTSWGSGVWGTAVSAQTASHLPADELRHYGRFYALLERIAGAELQEEAAWTTLFELAGPGRPFTQEDARTYRRAISQARELNGLISGFSIREQQLVNIQHMPFDQKIFATRVETREEIVMACGAPTGVPPATYGEAPATGFSAVARAHISPAEK